MSAGTGARLGWGVMVVGLLPPARLIMAFSSLRPVCARGCNDGKKGNVLQNPAADGKPKGRTTSSMDPHLLQVIFLVIPNSSGIRH